MEKRDEAVIVEYKITGREDGRWLIESFDREGKPLGGKIFCNDSNHAWEIWAVLNGQSHLVPKEQIAMNEDTQEIDLTKVGT
jgi:Fe-S cluster biosynthesis and repair protein YggX